MAGRLKGKVALIRARGWAWGASLGALRRGRCARGWRRDINAKAAAETVDLVGKAGGQAVAVTGDVAVEADVKRMVEEGVGAFGALHVLL